MRIFAALLVLLALPACGDSILDSYPFPDGDVLFMYPPVDLAGVRFMLPMGEANVLPRDHGGFDLTEPYNFPASVPVLAVSDGVITHASLGTRSVPPIPDAPEASWGRTYDDHLLVLKVHESILVNYAHVTDFHPNLASRLGNLPRDENAHSVAVEVSAGDTLGFVGPHGAMDFSITDFRLQLNFLNPSRYPRKHTFAAHVPDYFEEPIRTQLNSMSLRELPPRGGKVDYDVQGTIAGNWFLEGTTRFIQWSRQLAIVYDHIFGDRIIIADGSPMRDVPGIEGPGYPDTWWVKGNAPLPETVGVADGVVRYDLLIPDKRDLETVRGTLLVQALEGDRIRVEFREEGAPSAFTSAARTYVR